MPVVAAVSRIMVRAFDCQVVRLATLFLTTTIHWASWPAEATVAETLLVIACRHHRLTWLFAVITFVFADAADFLERINCA